MKCITYIISLALAVFSLDGCINIDDLDPWCGPSPSTGIPSSTTANCYIVSNPGSYSFPTVKGGSTETVGTVVYADVLWESFGTDVKPSAGDLISSVSYSSGKISYTVASPFREGNAVIAARDASGTILWSWHIWLTDQPDEQVYNNNAGTMMDRNLGATSATPGDVGALGLLYQWGRKDPFLGSSSISSSTLAKSTITWPPAVNSNTSNGTIEYATANPTTFITYNSSNYDWYYTGSSSTDNTRWQSEKTIYDPCPVGWRVPDGGEAGVWSRASEDWHFNHTYDSVDEGMNFSGKFADGSTIWYPAAGFRRNSDGALGYVRIHGSCWSVAPGSINACRLYFGGCSVIPTSNYGRAYGFSVRCLQE